MPIGTFFSLAWTLLGRGFSSGGLADTAERIAEKVVALRNAATEVEKAQIEREIVQLKAIHDLQKPSSSTWFSPMMVGQYLIVISFGLWWAGVFAVSVVNGLWGTDFVIFDVPPHIFEMAKWVIPAIVVGTLLEKRR